MRVVSVSGRSGSGKTTFIRQLIPHLSRLGRVGTLKHTGHHRMELPDGKDTTVMFEAGAESVTGIDSGKLLATLRRNTVTDALDLLAAQGTDIAVIEGFKESRLPRIIIGDLESEFCVLRNPAIEDVVRNLDRFPEYVTSDEMLLGIRRKLGTPSPIPWYVTCRRDLGCDLTEESIGHLKTRLQEREESAASRPGILAVRAAVHRGYLFGGSNAILIALAAGDGETGSLALAEIVRGMGNSGK